MKRHLAVAALTAFGICAAVPALSANCAQRTEVVEKLASKYDEKLAAGGLQKTRSDKSFMEIWASSKTGTFTVLITSPQGVSCIVAAGTDFFKASDAPEPDGSES